MKILKFKGCLQKSEGSSSIVKGFASMNSPDREEDLIPPEAFNIPQFMANPQLMINHDFTYDEKGNQRTVGKIVYATVAMVKDAGSVWDVIDLSSGEKVDTLSKERLPEGVTGMRGLFVRASVEYLDAQEMVASGELNSFSWRGIVRAATVAVNGVKRVIAATIDLMEVSLVHIPANYNATFEMAKSFQKGVEGSTTKNLQASDEDTPLSIVSVRFSADIFSEESAKVWLESNGFELSALSSEGHELHYRVSDEEYDVLETLSFQYGKGIQVLVAKEKSYVQSKAQTDVSDKLTNLLKNTFTPRRSEMKIKFTDDNWAELQGLFKNLASTEESFESIPEEGSQLYQVLKQLSDFFTTPADDEFNDLVKSLSSEVTKSLDPVLQTVVDSVQTLVETLSKSAASPDEEEVPTPEQATDEDSDKEEVVVDEEIKGAPAAPQPATKQAQLVHALAGLFTRLEKAEGDVETLSKSVAAPSARELDEGVTKDTNPNSVFPQGWPFTS